MPSKMRESNIVPPCRSNQKICKAWCDNRNGKGCQNPCPKKEKHNYCDVLISQNQACGENHVRANHTGPIYGYVQ